MSSGEIQRRAGRKTRPPSLLEKLTAYQKVIRDLDLTLHEWALLTVVVDRTVGWGKPHREITLEELTTSCRISARSVRRASAGLVKAGLVEVLFTGRTNRYGVTEAMMPALKIPKRRKIEKGEEPQPQPNQWGRVDSQADQTVLKGQGPYKNNTPRGDETIKKTVPPSNDGGRAQSSPRKRTRPLCVEEAVEQERAKGRSRKARQITTTKPGDLWRTWEDAHSECGLGQPVGWGTKATQAKVKRFTEAFPGDKANELHAFLNWVVYEWRGAVAKELSWMKDFPSMPVLDVMLAHLERLVAYWRGGGVKVGEEWRNGPYADEIESLLIDGNNKRAKELMRAT